MTLAERNDVVRGLLRELAERSQWEAEHATRVSVYAVAAGTVLGLTDRELLNLRYAAMLHDIGKLAWPAEWLKGGEGTDPDSVRSHPSEGERRLRKFPFLRAASKIVRQHHERCDGTGYPDGHMADEISLSAKILAAAEVFDIRRHGAPWASASEEPLAALESPGFDAAAVGALRRVESLIQPVGS